MFLFHWRHRPGRQDTGPESALLLHPGQKKCCRSLSHPHGLLVRPATWWVGLRTQMAAGRKPCVPVDPTEKAPSHRLLQDTRRSYGGDGGRFPAEVPLPQHHPARVQHDGRVYLFRTNVSVLGLTFSQTPNYRWVCGRVREREEAFKLKKTFCLQFLTEISSSVTSVATRATWSSSAPPQAYFRNQNWQLCMWIN